MSVQEIYKEEEIDEVAARLREMSPKFEDMIRPEIIETQKWLEYIEEVKKSHLDEKMSLQ